MSGYARRLFSVAAAIAALGLTAGSAAGATSLLFTYVEAGPGAIDASWNQSSNPAAFAYDYFYYTAVPVFNWTGNVGPYGGMYYYSFGIYGNGGFSTPDGTINVYGGQYYGFPESNPYFVPGVWTGVNATDGLPFTLTAIAVPEPSEWAIMLLGLGGVGVGLRIARRTKHGATV